jgi:hypothetical protein
MRRTVLFAVLLLTGCGAPVETEQVPPGRAAEPQHLRLGWRESYPSKGERLRFAVDELTVRTDGWSARIGVTNATRRTFELGVNRPQLSFGLMLFETGELEELEQANREGRLPSARLATTIEPPPPDLLAPGVTWRATLSGPGALADGSWVRVSFGPLRVVGDPPEGMQSIVFWITDRSHRL